MLASQKQSYRSKFILSSVLPVGNLISECLVYRSFAFIPQLNVQNLRFLLETKYTWFWNELFACGVFPNTIG